MKALVVVALAAGAAIGSGERGAVPTFHVIILPPSLRGMMSAVWIQNNRHWDDLAGVNTLTQLLGTAKPTQREYLGCLAGEVANDTLWIRALLAAADLKQLQFAVAGNCDAIDGFVGTWHTHPYRAGLDGRALKEPGLSALDLETFASARDLVALVMWDVDSLDVAAKGPDGSVRHPAPLTLR